MPTGSAALLSDHPHYAALPAMPLTVRVPEVRGSDTGEHLERITALPESAVVELCKARPEFELVARLGEGAFGRVYLARQHDLGGRLVALKISSESMGEAEILAKLLHTNIVPIYSTHRLGYCHAVCMPYLGATTLADVLAEIRESGLPESGRYLVSALQSKRGPQPENPIQPDGGDLPFPSEAIPKLPPSTRAILDGFNEMSYTETVMWLGQQLADGLAHAHERGVIHRDLKPANVLLTDEGQPMLLDFNLAEIVATPEKAKLGGTLAYMAPEALLQVLGGDGQTGPGSDIYALGLILFELLSGRRPEPRCEPGASAYEYAEHLAAHRSCAPPSLRDLNPAVSPALDAIIRRCLEPDATLRYRSARELQDDLKRQREHQPLRYAPEPSLVERVRKWGRRHPRVASLSSALSLTGGLLLVLACATFGFRERALNLEADRSLTAFREEAVEAHLCASELSTVEADECARRARVALGRYSALDDPRWRERSAVGRLSADKRDELDGTIAALLLALARGEAMRAAAASPGEGRDAHLSAAWHFNEQAERTGGERLPRAIWAQKADLFAIGGDAENERAARKAAAAQPPRDGRDAFAAGRELVAQARFDEALTQLTDATRQGPGDAAAWLLLGRCQEALGRDRDSVASYSTLLGLRPRTGVAHFRRGIAYLRLNDCPQALDDFTRAVDLQHEPIDAHFNRGLTLHRLGRSKEALAEIDRALELKAPYARLYFVRARIREQAGDAAGAKLDRQEGLSREPADETCWMARGVARFATDPRGALHDFDEALRVNPRSLPALTNSAHVLADHLGQAEEALARLDRAVKWHAHSADAHARRGLLLARLNRRDEAHSEAAAVLKAKPPSAEWQAALIYAQTSRGEAKDRPEALRLLRAALRKGYGYGCLQNADLAPLRELAEYQELLQAARKLQ